MRIFLAFFTQMILTYMKNKIIKLINTNKIDVLLLFEHYVRQGGLIHNIEEFHSVYTMWLQYNRASILDIYKVFMLEYNINIVKDEEGRIIKAY